MQSIDQYNSNLGTAVLLVGGAGSGKTVLGCRLFPKTYVFVADPNFASGKRYLEKINETSNVVGFDNALVENEKPVPTNQRYDRMFKLLNLASQDPAVDCIFLDGATNLEDIFKAKICGATSDDRIKLQNFDQWGSYILIWKSFVLGLRQSGKKLIISAHEKKERDESDGIWKYTLALDGQIKDKFSGMMSDVWRCEIVEANNKHSWTVRTLGNVRQEHLKNNFGFEGVVPADDIVKMVRGTK